MAAQGRDRRRNKIKSWVSVTTNGILKIKSMQKGTLGINE